MIVNKDNKVGWHLRVSSYFYALPHCLPACFSPSSKIFRIWLLSHRLFCWFLLVCSMKIWEALGHIKISKMQCCSVILSIQLIDNRVGYTCGMRTCESLQVRNGVDDDDTLDWQRLGSAHMVRHTQQTEWTIFGHKGLQGCRGSSWEWGTILLASLSSNELGSFTTRKNSRMEKAGVISNKRNSNLADAAGGRRGFFPRVVSDPFRNQAWYLET